MKRARWGRRWQRRRGIYRLTVIDILLAFQIPRRWWPGFGIGPTP